MKDTIFYGFLFWAGLAGLLLLFFSYGIFASHNYPEKIVKCYDRSYNEIIGQKCIEKDYPPFNNMAITDILLFATIIITGEILYLRCIEKHKERVKWNL